MTDKQFYVLIGAGVLGLIYLARVGGQAAGAALNPTDPGNLAYRAVNAVGDIFDDGRDDDSFRLGTWLYDWTHPESRPATGGQIELGNGGGGW